MKQTRITIWTMTVAITCLLYHAALLDAKPVRTLAETWTPYG